jgi:circadian clock protein KaiB
MGNKPRDLSRDFEKAAREAEQGQYILRLYVSGMTQRSRQAIANIKQICEEHLKGRYELEVVDVYQYPDQLRKDQVVAIPTLVKELPKPLRRVIGDLFNTEEVLIGLDLISRQGDSQG